MNDQFVPEATVYTTHNKQISLPSARFEPAISAIKPPQNHELDRTAKEIGSFLMDYSAVFQIV
jgi:hypothetical protein